MPSCPWTTRARSRPTWPSASATGLSQRRRSNTPNQLALHQGRVRHRPQQIENGARGCEFHPGPRDIAHGAVMARCHHEADARPRPGAFSSVSIGRSRLMPSAPSTSAAPDFEVKARLPCLATGTHGARHHQGGAGGDVVGAMVIAAGADDVDRALRRLHALDLGAQHLGAARQLLGRLATYLQSHQEGPHLGWRGVARRHDVECPLGLGEVQRLAVAYLGQKAAKIVDVAAQTLAPICPLPADRQGA